MARSSTLQQLGTVERVNRCQQHTTHVNAPSVEEFNTFAVKVEGLAVRPGLRVNGCRLK